MSENNQANQAKSQGARQEAKKAFMDQVKQVIQNKDQIKEQVVENISIAGKIVEAQAKQFVKETKKTKFFNESIVPLAESDMADKAIDVLNTKLKLKDTSIMKTIEKVRKDILDTKLSNAKVAKPAPADEANEKAAPTPKVKKASSTEK